MSQQNSAGLTAENQNIANQSNPGSVGQPLVCQMYQDIIDSMWNKVDSPLTLPPANITIAALATAIGASTLNPLQWLQITNRADSNPLWIQCLTNNTISPFGMWVKAGKVCMVVMDYVNGYEGQTKPFIASFDAATQSLFLTQTSGNSNAGINTILRASSSLTFTSVSNGGSQTQNFTVTGAAVGDCVTLGIDNAATGGLVMYQAWVAAPDTVTVQLNNLSGLTVTKTGTFIATIIK